MGSFARQLRKDFEAAPPWGQINPLVIIGLTEAVLDLGLTEDQLYNSVRSFARQLSAQVHPDRNPANISLDRQKQIIGAFDFIDHRENFSMALSDFKELKAEDRHENRLLTRGIEALKQQLYVHKDNVYELEEKRKKVEDDRRNYLMNKASEPELIPELNRMNGVLIAENKRLNRLNNSLHHGVLDWKFKYTAAFKYIMKLIQPPNAFDAKWVATATLLHSNPITPEYAQEGIRAIAKQISITRKKLTEVNHMWRSAIMSFGENVIIKKRTYSLSFDLIRLEAGLPVNSINDYDKINGRIIGSIDAVALPEEEKKKHRLRYVISKDLVIGHLDTALKPGNMIVSASIKKENEYSFNTRRYILGVG